MEILQLKAVKNRQGQGIYAIIYITKENGNINLNYNFVSNTEEYRKGIERSLKKGSILNSLLLFKRSNEKEILDLVENKLQIGFMNRRFYFLTEINGR